MRLSTFLRLSLAAAALVPAPAATAAPAMTGAVTAAPAGTVNRTVTAASAVTRAAPRDPGASCAAGGRAFPLTTRMHGGPRSYEAGGAHGTWFLDLTNTTDRTCEDVHPVVVLVDEKRVLRASQARLEFYAEGRPHPVRLETTDRDELVGAFGTGAPGLTIGPRQTRTVKVRLSVTPDAAANEVTATAAVVRRRGDDGDWIGQSGDYRFRIAPAGTAHLPEGSESRDGGGTGAPPDPTGPRPRESGSALPAASGVLPPGRPSLADELAVTGVARARTVLAAATLLVALGCTFVHFRERLRPGRSR